MEPYHVIGLMSGTSLDGVDVAFCTFIKEDEKWIFSIGQAETFSYSDEWKNKLNHRALADAFTFVKTHVEYGHYLGGHVKNFVAGHVLKKIDFVASHGHTVFHQPSNKITCQIGDGAAISAVCGLPVICDFRTMDVALGGQGAPLVPIGDKLLFSEYDFCLNLGGIANISYDVNRTRIAYDICPVNMALNYLSKNIQREYDENGHAASQGIIDSVLFSELEQLSFYHQKPPKSLGKEWFVKEFVPVLEKSNIPVQDKLRTVCEHIAAQTAKICNAKRKKREEKLLVTGGGVFNTFLMNLIKAKAELQTIVPDDKTIKFKEALIFAFLGVLKSRNEINCLKSVTGASKDNTGGAVYGNMDFYTLNGQ